MKGLSLVLFVLLASNSLIAQGSPATVTLRGYVVDALCGAAMAGKPSAMARAARHTRRCALDENCAAAGYGIISDGKWVKFDAKGDALAKAAITASKRERGHYFEVKGSMSGDLFSAVSLKESSPKK